MQGPRQTLVQQQRLTLSHQMQQSMKLMGLPLADLRDRIIEEAEKNPAIEIVSDPFVSSLWTPAWGGPEQFPASAGGGDEESDGHRDFIEGTLHREESLQEHLLEQLGEQPLPEPVLSLAEQIIQNLDRDGFHIVPPTELAGAENRAVLDAALRAVRSFDPVGCATADFRETLAVQARFLETGYSAAHLDPAIVKTINILENHFDLLEKGRPADLAKALSHSAVPGLTLTVEEAEDVFEIIRSLDPFPGRAFDNSPGSFIVPEVFVNKTEDGYDVVIDDEQIPVLKISSEFKALESGEADDGGNPAVTDPKAREFARVQINDARWFMRTVRRRYDTIRKVSQELVAHQREFFDHGPSHLRPLRMKDIAEKIGVVESTVSRATKGKYLQCEWGLFELKYFFSNRVGSDLPSADSPSSGVYTAGRYSKQGVKEMIREMIAGSKETLSDQKIADQLADRGIKLARRTVAKYRGELTIKSSFER